jgi:hypothetical protein
MDIGESAVFSFFEGPVERGDIHEISCQQRTDGCDGQEREYGDADTVF